MKRMQNTLRLFCFLAPIALFGQGVRVDSNAFTVAGNVPFGASAPVLAVPGATLNVCSDQACTIAATTYTDLTLATPCPSNAQIVLPGSTGCVSTTSQTGAYGFYVAPGQYAFKVTLPSGQVLGPYPVTAYGTAGGYVYDANYPTLAGACTAAGSGALYVTKIWTGLTATNTAACLNVPLTFLGIGKLQPTSGQNITLNGAITAAPGQKIFDYSAGGTVTITTPEPFVYPGWWGAVSDGSTDDGGAINAAIASLPNGGTLALPGNKTTALATTVTVTNGVILEVSGGSIKWIGSSASTARAVVIAGTNSGIRNGTITTGVAGAVGLSFETCTGCFEQNINITGVTSSTGFNTAARLTGNGSSTSCYLVHLDGLTATYYISFGLTVDHSLETVYDDVALNANANNTTAIDLIFDQGAQANYLHNVRVSGGLHGVVWQSTNLNGSYGAWPNQFFVTKLVSDSTTGGDGMVFDSSLAANPIQANDAVLWSAAAGLNTSGTVVTSSANGIGIYGGTNISIIGGQVRDNALHGVLINGSNVRYVKIKGADFTENNQSNNADGDALHVTTANSDIEFSGNLCANYIGQYPSGHTTHCSHFVTNTNNDITISLNRAPSVTSSSPFYVASYSPANAGFSIFGNSMDQHHIFTVPENMGLFGITEGDAGCFIIPNPGTGGSLRQGFSCGVYWDVPSQTWITLANSGSNGGFIVESVIGSNTLTMRQIPSTGGGTMQTFTDTQLAALPYSQFDVNGFRPQVWVFASLPSAPNDGVEVYCSDCKSVGNSVVAGTVCAGSGTGAFAHREGGVWRCF